MECDAVWLPADDLRWRAYLLGDEPEAPAEGIAFYCPECAEHEFGRASPSS